MYTIRCIYRDYELSHVPGLLSSIICRADRQVIRTIWAEQHCCPSFRLLLAVV